jgi:hypothetical protein
MANAQSGWGKALFNTRTSVEPNVSADELYVPCVFRYCQAFNATSGSVSAIQSFSGNNPWDCLGEQAGTSTANKAQGYAMYGTLYNFYQVLASKIHVEFFNTDTAAPCLVAVIPTPSQSSSNQLPVDYSGKTVADIQYILNGKTAIATINSAEQKVTIDHYMSSMKLYGKHIDQLDDTIATIDQNPVVGPPAGPATLAGVPARQWFWAVYAKTMGASSVVTLTSALPTTLSSVVERQTLLSSKCKRAPTAAKDLPMAFLTAGTTATAILSRLRSSI